MANSELKALLKGVDAERGATVTCRDPSALEMLLRIGNSDANRGSVSAIFQNTNTSSSATVRMLFINGKNARYVEEEVQRWLDPFKMATVAANADGERKRTRTDSESDSDSDDFEGESDSDSSRV
ncbi:hypothetical protein JKF63_05324 [Porcisia hertigi]|uniref:Uncharacterized protein n=1 Tax=Porcisia hertigi TaxID=2761500 RepID=A0A836LFR7_9TRYP|nr:hypothetical protein JKF63_05324 [Porcisia hertigi]